MFFFLLFSYVYKYRQYYIIVYIHITIRLKHRHNGKCACKRDRDGETVRERERFVSAANRNCSYGVRTGGVGCEYSSRWRRPDRIAVATAFTTIVCVIIYAYM